MSRYRVVRALLATAAGALLLAACGGGGASNGISAKSANEILSAVVKAVDAAQSAHVTGHLVNGGRTADLDLTLFKNGDVDGTFGVGGGNGRMLVVGKSEYFKGSTNFWQNLSSFGGSALPQSTASRLAGNWIKVPGGSSGLGAFSLQGLGKSLATGTSKHPPKRAGTKTVDGQSAVGITEAGQGTMWVATTGTAYPIELVKITGKNTERITFSSWNEGSPPSAPSGAKTIQQLLGLG